MEKVNRRNLEKYKSKISNMDSYQHILEVDKLQIELVDKWILPYVDIIIADLLKIREKVDKKLKKSEIVRRRKKNEGKDYPIGMCLEIRDAVMKEILGNSGMGNSYQGLKAIRSFIREGGIIQPFWAIENGKFFQNAMQFGSSIIDVADDTYDPKRPKVVFYKDIESSPLRNMESVEEIADIMEKYWNRDVYPNTLFPNLAPFFPLITIFDATDNRTGKSVKVVGLSSTPFTMFYNRNMNDLDMVNDENGKIAYGMPNKYSYDFIFKSKYKDKFLPESIRNKFREKFVKFEDDTGHMLHFTEDKDEIRNSFMKYSIPRTHDMDLLKGFYKENQETGKRISRNLLSIENKVFIKIDL